MGLERAEQTSDFAAGFQDTTLHGRVPSLSKACHGLSWETKPDTNSYPRTVADMFVLEDTSSLNGHRGSQPAVRLLRNQDTFPN